MAKKNKKDNKPQVHQELEGFEITINEFGQIISNIDVSKMNTFLNKHLDDKKLREKEEFSDNLLDEYLDIEDENLEENEILPNFEAIDSFLELDDNNNSDE